MNLTGQTFGKLKVISLSDKKIGDRITYLCLCLCGNKKDITGKALKLGVTKSCGCLRKESKNIGSKNGRYLHGMYRTRMNYIWNSMIQRCHNPKIKRDKWNAYGGRGIKVCDRWREFINFYEDMKDTYKDDLTLDRINTNGNYEPNNCRWVSMLEQANNTRTNNLITYKGKTLSISQWAVKTGIGWTTIDRRKKLGLDPKDIFKAIKPPQCYSYDKHCNKYRVHVKGKDLGRFKTKKEAIHARDNYLCSKSHELLQTIN